MPEIEGYRPPDRGELIPEEPPVELTTEELIIYHADRLKNEIRDALDDGKITVWEALSLGFSVLLAALGIVKRGV